MIYIIISKLKTMKKCNLFLFICVSFLFACNSQKSYIISNKSFIKILYPYNSLKRYVYMDELNTKITDSIFMQHYFKNLTKKSVRYFECIDPVAEIYMLKCYTLGANGGFQYINKGISKRFIDQKIGERVVLEYYINNLRVSSKEEVFKVISLETSMIYSINYDLSESKDSCKVNIILK